MCVDLYADHNEIESELLDYDFGMALSTEFFRSYLLDSNVNLVYCEIIE